MNGIVQKRLFTVIVHFYSVLYIVNEIYVADNKYPKSYLNKQTKLSGNKDSFSTAFKISAVLIKFQFYFARILRFNFNLKKKQSQIPWGLSLEVELLNHL